MRTVTLNIPLDKLAAAMGLGPDMVIVGLEQTLQQRASGHFTVLIKSERLADQVVQPSLDSLVIGELLQIGNFVESCTTKSIEEGNRRRLENTEVWQTVNKDSKGPSGELRIKEGVVRKGGVNSGPKPPRPLPPPPQPPGRLLRESDVPRAK